MRDIVGASGGAASAILALADPERSSRTEHFEAALLSASRSNRAGQDSADLLHGLCQMDRADTSRIPAPALANYTPLGTNLSRPGLSQRVSVHINPIRSHAAFRSAIQDHYR